MSYVIEADYVLANILKDKEIGESVGMKDLISFEYSVITKARSKGIELYVDLTDDSISTSLEIYNAIFKMIGNEIYKITEINIDIFNKQLPENLLKVII